MKPTFGYEWEIGVFKEDFNPLEDDETLDISTSLRDRNILSRTGIDFMVFAGRFMLELRSGILKSYSELQERADEIFSILLEEKKKRKFLIFPAGFSPIANSSIGLHTHTGSFYKPEWANKRADAVFHFAPVLGALASNSPVYQTKNRRKFKSFRIFRNADFASSPYRLQESDNRQFTWGTDVCNKTADKPTIEVRIGDSASSLRFLKEYVLLTTAIVLSPPPQKTSYLEYILNRYNASRYGLQSIFLWNGKEREVVDVLKIILSYVEKKTLRKLGGKFSLIPEMIEKRISQANMLEEVGNDDILQFNYEVDRIASKDLFPEYLKRAEKKEVNSPLSLEEMVLENIEGEVSFRDLYASTQVPYKYLQKTIEKLKRKGELSIRNDPEFGLLLSQQNS